MKSTYMVAIWVAVFKRIFHPFETELGQNDPLLLNKALYYLEQKYNTLVYAFGR